MSGAGRRGWRRSLVVRDQRQQRFDRGVDGRELPRREPLQARGEPCGPARLDGTEDEPGPLQPVDVTRHRRGGDPLELRQVANADTAVPLDLEQERDLPAGDAERVRLTPQLARQLQQRGAQAVRNGERLEGEDGHSLAILTKIVRLANYRLLVHALLAGERSTLPARSIARTWKVCRPLVSCV